MTRTISVSVSFMMSGPAFVVDLPGHMERQPEALASVGLPGGGRECVFVAIARGRPAYPPELYGPTTLIEGRKDEVYVTLRHAEPVHWFIDWHLPNGTLRSHVRDDDGEEMVAVVVDCLQVESQQGESLPVLLPRSPISRATSRAPGYQESISFVDSFDGREEEIRLIRPGAWRRKPRVLGSQIQVGTAVGVDVEGIGVEEAVLLEIQQQLESQLMWL